MAWAEHLVAVRARPVQVVVAIGWAPVPVPVPALPAPVPVPVPVPVLTVQHAVEVTARAVFAAVSRPGRAARKDCP